MTMLEKITAAIAKAVSDSPFLDFEQWDYEADDTRKTTLREFVTDTYVGDSVERIINEAATLAAQAALTVMLEPSEEMVNVFNEYHAMPYNPASTYRAQHTFKAMIRAALEEEK